MARKFPCIIFILRALCAHMIIINKHANLSGRKRFQPFITICMNNLIGILIISLKGKISSGIEGALASTLNHDFNWKQLSEMILCIFLLMF